MCARARERGREGGLKPDQDDGHRSLTDQRSAGIRAGGGLETNITLHNNEVQVGKAGLLDNR